MYTEVIHSFFHVCALHCVFLPTASPTSPSRKTLRCGGFFCEWGVNGVCSTSHLSTGSVWHLLLELMTHRALVARNFMLRLERFNESRCHLFFSPPDIEMDYTCICKLLLTVCASKVATWFAAFFFLLSLHPSKSLSPFLPPSPLEQMYCYSSTLPPASPTCTLALCLSQSYISV